MRKRTRAREFSLQALYQVDIAGGTAEAALDNIWQAHQAEQVEDEIKSFATELVCGVVENLDPIDKKIIQYAANWKLERMAVVDRNILRLGGFELLFRKDIPPKVSINEAVELAKKYSDKEAAKFVNGILDKIKIEAGR
ncbi:MAG: transcription antitermination factor NusB [Candidatus Omnitrophica bacterium]|nr:transcription antitermination factor NusB [Candidatus Omnitrophota bacterium]